MTKKSFYKQYKSIVNANCTCSIIYSFNSWTRNCCGWPSSTSEAAYGGGKGGSEQAPSSSLIFIFYLNTNFANIFFTIHPKLLMVLT